MALHPLLKLSGPVLMHNRLLLDYNTCRLIMGLTAAVNNQSYGNSTS